MLKGKTPLLIALVLAALAGALAWYQIDMYKKEVTRGWQLEDVIVAGADLQPGAFLSNDSVAVDKMPRKFIYESVLVPADMEVALGREVIVPIKRGEPIHWYQLQGIRALERLSKTLKRGARAISIDITERSSVGQWVRPNDQVDVLGTFRDPNSNQMVAVTLLQNIVVLATGQSSRSSQSAQRTTEQDYGTVTLMVIPEEAEVLVLAQELGSIYLTLRNKSDLSIFEERMRTTMQTLLTGERLRKYRERRLRTIQIIRGTQGAKRRQ